MVIFLNGEFLPEERAVVSVLDRGFLYGDGLFETMRVFNGKPFRWPQHCERLQRGADFLGIRLPFPAEALRRFVGELIAKNHLPDALLRLMVSRGVGPRGYSPKGADKPTVTMSLHPAPEIDPANPPAWRLATASVRLPSGETLAQFKTCNKLPQILARAEGAAAGADESLLLNTDGFVVEASSSNLFWIDGGAVCTAPLAGGILPGVTREAVLEICTSLGISIRERNLTSSELKRMDAVFLSLSSFGIVEAASLDGAGLKTSPLAGRIREAYRELVRRETT